MGNSTIWPHRDSRDQYEHLYLFSVSSVIIATAYRQSKHSCVATPAISLPVHRPSSRPVSGPRLSGIPEWDATTL
ncbi:hypothetical protein L873DRAFT_1048508 [Choiromyces venosus 120613-1]|uniref:Uncharacterized protein n=1 Tax=Choiromyces venosus 120613-1 TaxID=1336337 RepID=A0A3N4JJ48_9PEZI|nr:hypothetical protein L873DRAFT_1048508 [Choiromyces venosus 120613-1]